jgi:hypothetical protein
MTSETLYQQPTVLSRQKHKNILFTPQKDLSYTQNINSVPINTIEFSAASRELPIMFSKDKDDNYLPIAMLSLENKGHHLLTDKGVWKTEVYVPAFLRRYPFILSGKGAVCIDAKAPHFADKQTGKPLLTETGEFTPILKGAMTFLNRYEKQGEKTREFADACKAAEILKPCPFKIRQGKGKVLKLDNLYMIDVAKLSKLPAETVVEWHKKGWLALAYAHLNSLSSFQRLLERQKEHEKAIAAAH